MNDLLEEIFNKLRDKQITVEEKQRYLKQIPEKIPDNYLRYYVNLVDNSKVDAVIRYELIEKLLELEPVKAVVDLAATLDRLKSYDDLHSKENLWLMQTKDKIQERLDELYNSKKLEPEAEVVYLITTALPMDEFEFERFLDKLEATKTERAKEFIKERFIDGHPLIAHVALKKAFQLGIPVTFRMLADVLNNAERRYRTHVNPQSTFYPRWLHDHGSEMERLRKYACEKLIEVGDIDDFYVVFEELVTFHEPEDYELYNYWLSVYHHLIKTCDPQRLLLIAENLIHINIDEMTKPNYWEAERELIHAINILVLLKEHAKELIPTLVNSLGVLLTTYDQEITLEGINNMLKYLGYKTDDSLLEYGLMDIIVDALHDIDPSESLREMKHVIQTKEDISSYMENIVQYFEAICGKK